MEVALKYFEDRVCKVIIRAEDFFSVEYPEFFRTDQHLHAFTKAFGIPEQRMCIPVGVYPAVGEFYISSNSHDKFILKLIGIWKEWRKFGNHVRIQINDITVYEGILFLENVCRGWPAVYLDIKDNVIKDGKNFIVIKNLAPNQNTLMLERIEIYKIEPCSGEIFYFPKIIRSSIFSVRVNTPEEPIIFYDDKILKNIKVEKRDSYTEYFFYASKREIPYEVEIKVKLKQKIFSKKVIILPVSSSLEFYVGIDSDDHRFDLDREFERSIELLYYTQMGNFVSIRPGFGRNFFNNLFESRIEEILDFLESRGIKYQISLNSNIPIDVSILQNKKHFIGFQFHEPYLAFNKNVGPVELFDSSEMTIEERKDFYLKYLKDIIGTVHKRNNKISCYDPSLFVCVSSQAGFDIMGVEPVSRMSLLLGAIRGAWKDVGWGVHIPIDWYLGFPHDETKNRRFLLTLLLSWTYGAKYSYAENGVLKTNAYSRFDYEDDFVKENRKILRDVYKLSILYPRKGTPIRRLAIAYGNNEDIFWLPDDRIPELIDTENWDKKFWGKWNVQDHYWCWLAADAWLPPFSTSQHGKNPSLTKMFTGTPFGSVDVVPIDKLDNKNYSAVALLGWNTMTSSIYEKIKSFVEKGGKFFLFLKHFEISRIPSMNSLLYNEGNLKDLIGFNIEGEGDIIEKVIWNGQEYPIIPPFVYDRINYYNLRKGKKDLLPEYRTYKIKNFGAKVLAFSQDREPVLLSYKLGKGEIFVLNTMQWPSTRFFLNFIKDILKNIGLACKIPPFLEGEDTRYIDYNIWKEKDITTMYLVNVDWKDCSAKKINIYPWEKYHLKTVVNFGKIRILSFNDEIGILYETGEVGLENLQITKNKITAYLIGSGNFRVNLFSKKYRRYKVIDKDYPIDKDLTLDINGIKKIEIEFK